MSEGGNQSVGLKSGRQWSALPEQDPPLEWTMDSEGPFMQGPLDLEFLRGKKIFLNLADGQMGLLADKKGEGNELKAIFLDGGHILDIGHRPGQVSTESRLFFLTGGHELEMRWTFGSPLALPGTEQRHIIGSCTLAINGPARFFRSFLAENDNFEVVDLLEEVEYQTGKALTDHLLAAESDNFYEAAEWQSALLHLQAETLSENLESLGLRCEHLALYTAEPPVEHHSSPDNNLEMAGQNPDFAHN